MQANYVYLRALTCHSANVVAAQVHQHNMLRSFFFVGQQLLGQCLVLFRGYAAPPGARNGVRCYCNNRAQSLQRVTMHGSIDNTLSVAFHLDELFWRCANNLWRDGVGE